MLDKEIVKSVAKRLICFGIGFLVLNLLLEFIQFEIYDWGYYQDISSIHFGTFTSTLFTFLSFITSPVVGILCVIFGVVINALSKAIKEEK